MAEAQLSARPGPREGPLPGLWLSVSSVGRGGERLIGVCVGGRQGKERMGKSERRETGREGGRLGEQRVLSN